MRLFFDESGFTGEDLANSAQPIFVLASTRADNSFSAETYRRIFAQVKSPELKHSSLARTAIGRRRVLDFLGAVRGFLHSDGPQHTCASARQAWRLFPGDEISRLAVAVAVRRSYRRQCAATRPGFPEAPAHDVSVVPSPAAETSRCSGPLLPRESPFQFVNGFRAIGRFPEN